MIPPVLGRLGLAGEQVQLVGKVMGQPLWFLGVYVVVVALAPVMVRLHRRFRLWVPATLAAAAAAVDAVRLAAGIHQVDYLNLLVVWKCWCSSSASSTPTAPWSGCRAARSPA